VKLKSRETGFSSTGILGRVWPVDDNTTFQDLASLAERYRFRRSARRLGNQRARNGVSFHYEDLLAADSTDLGADSFQRRDIPFISSAPTT
jgi:hypothetical protein